jgi:tetratricopeptide (TPR) repeat protein
MQPLRDALDLLARVGPVPAVLAMLSLLFAAAALWVARRKTPLQRAVDAIGAGDFAQARVWAEDAVRQAPIGLPLARALDAMGTVHLSAGESHEAAACYRQALELREHHLPAGDTEITASLFLLAHSLDAAGRAAEAEAAYRRALSLLRRSLGSRHAHSAASLVPHVRVCLLTGAFDQAADLAEELRRLTESALGPDHLDTAEVLLLEAEGAAQRGRFHQADLAYRECLAIRERVLGPDHPATLVAGQQRANLLLGWVRLTGDAAALQVAGGLAERFVWRAQTAFRSQRNWTVEGLRTLAWVRTLQHRPVEAVALAREAVALAEETLRPGHLICGWVWLRLARSLDEAGEPDEAVGHAQKALALYTRRSGPDHFTTGEVYEVLGRLAARQGRWEEAEGHLRKCLSVREPLGRTHPERAFALRELALLMRQADRDFEAGQAEQEAAAIAAAARRPGGQAHRAREERYQKWYGQPEQTELTR